MIERDPTVVLRQTIEDIVLEELQLAILGDWPNKNQDTEGVARAVALGVLQRLADLNIEVKRG